MWELRPVLRSIRAGGSYAPCTHSVAHGVPLQFVMRRQGGFLPVTISAQIRNASDTLGGIVVHVYPLSAWHDFMKSITAANAGFFQALQVKIQLRRWVKRYGYRCRSSKVARAILRQNTAPLSPSRPVLLPFSPTDMDRGIDAVNIQQLEQFHFSPLDDSFAKKLARYEGYFLCQRMGHRQKRSECIFYIPCRINTAACGFEFLDCKITIKSFR